MADAKVSVQMRRMVKPRSDDRVSIPTDKHKATFSQPQHSIRHIGSRPLPVYISSRHRRLGRQQYNTRGEKILHTPLATIEVIEGVFSGDERQRMIEKVTEAMVSVEGENLHEKTVVIVEEVKSGDGGIGGRTLATGDVKRLRASQ